jgi:hypothetical protein
MTTSGAGGAAALGGNGAAAGNASAGAFAAGGNSSGGAAQGGAGGSCPPPPCTGIQCQVATCAGAAHTTVTGMVYDPAGKVPLYGVTVYVPNAALAPMPSGPLCGQALCNSLSGQVVTSALTDTNGRFVLQDVPSGSDIPVVVQLGKWRRAVTVPRVDACTDNAFDDPNLFRLPRDATEGSVPKIAVTTGKGDALECFLHRIGIADSAITLYAGLGGSAQTQAGPALPVDALLGDVNALMPYDFVLMSCEESASQAELTPASYKNALKAYADAGGHAFLEHYQRAYLRSDSGYAPSPFADVTTGWTDTGPSNDECNIDVSFPKGDAFAAWLLNQGASVKRGVLPLGQIQGAASGLQATATGWLNGPSSVPLFTFLTPQDTQADLQCGKIIQFGFHVSTGRDDIGASFPGECDSGDLFTSEKALEFMLFDGPTCVQVALVPPLPPCTPPPI